MTIRVLIIDDHAVVRDGLTALLHAQPDIEVVGSFGEARDGLQAAAQLDPGVVILDIAMPRLNGIEAARLFQEDYPNVSILMLSMYADTEHVYQALRAGANGYVLKESAASEVVTAVRALYSGGRYMSERIGGWVLDDYLHGRAGDDPLDRLSARERQVMQQVVEGRTSAEIAALLNLSPKSVDTYRSRMMSKLSLEDLPSLVKFAIRHGITGVE